MISCLDQCPMVSFENCKSWPSKCLARSGVDWVYGVHRPPPCPGNERRRFQCPQLRTGDTLGDTHSSDFPFQLFFGAPRRIRTFDLWLRRPTLYPAELVAHTHHVPDLIGFSLLCNLLIQSLIQSFFQKIESNRDGVLRTIQPAWQHVAIKFGDSDRRMTQYLG